MNTRHRWKSTDAMSACGPRLALAIAAVAVVLSLATAGAAGAKTSHRSTLCTAFTAEQTSANNVASSISNALKAGHFSKAKTTMISAINKGLTQSAAALKALSAAPANVRAAMRGLINFDNRFKAAIKRSSSVSKLNSALNGLSNSTVSTDATTVSTYVTTQCGASALTTTTQPAG